MDQSSVGNLRQDARRLFMAGLQAADPTHSVRKIIDAKEGLTDTQGDLLIIALGKAACPMMKEITKRVPKKQACKTLVVTNRENPCELDGVEVIYGEHPVPGHNSLLAGQRIMELVDQLTANDKFILLLSGGGSALQVCPPENISLQDKVNLTEKLLISGADITELNIVRASLSRLKGGQLAQLATPAKVVSLILSDVPHDNIEFVASGPTVRPLSNTSTRQVLEKYGLWDDLDDHLKIHLKNTPGRTSADSQEFHHVENILIGGNLISVEAAIDAAKSTYDVTKLCDWLDGDVEMAAKTIYDAATQNIEEQSPARTALICGGETTVQVSGSGIGGRNQELALRFALLAEENPIQGSWVFLSAGTDGRDGPTDAAGAIVDATTLNRMRAAVINPGAHLANNDSYNALKPIDDLFFTGGTGTNVADLQILLQSKS